MTSVLILTLFLWTPRARAQGFEVSVFGGEVLSQTENIQSPMGGNLQINSNYAAGISYDHAFWGSRLFTPHAELELTVLPPRIVKSVSAAVPQNYDSLYFTPGLRLEFLPRAIAHPWVVAGGGYTLYIQSRVLTNGQTYSVRFVNTAAGEFGGGLDFRLWRSRHYNWSLDLRSQVRDFVSGNPALNVPVTSSVQHNIVASGGLVVVHHPAYVE